MTFLFKHLFAFNKNYYNRKRNTKFRTQMMHASNIEYKFARKPDKIVHYFVLFCRKKTRKRSVRHEIHNCPSCSIARYHSGKRGYRCFMVPWVKAESEILI